MGWGGRFFLCFWFTSLVNRSINPSIHQSRGGTLWIDDKHGRAPGMMKIVGRTLSHCWLLGCSMVTWSLDAAQSMPICPCPMRSRPFGSLWAHRAQKKEEASKPPAPRQGSCWWTDWRIRRAGIQGRPTRGQRRFDGGRPSTPFDRSPLELSIGAIVSPIHALQGEIDRLGFSAARQPPPQANHQQNSPAESLEFRD
jgi:hypothetical protein